MIKITSGDIVVRAELFECSTADDIRKALPFEGSANLWGDEIYFEIPVTADQAVDARADVEAGELGYWPVGRAFCLFYGPTPASIDEKPRAASPVNVFGKLIDDPGLLRHVKEGSTVKVENLEP